MFRAHRSCCATRRVERNIARKSLCKPFGERFRKGRAKNSSRAPTTFQERAKIAQERAKIAQERANIAQERAKIAQNRANIAQARVTIASRSRQKRFLVNFWSILGSSGSFLRRPRGDFGSIFVACVRSFARASVAAFGRLFVRSFVQSFARAFVRLSSPRPFDFELRVLVRSHTRSFAHSFVHVRSFACLLVCSLVRFLTSPKHVDTTARIDEAALAALFVAILTRSEQTTST